MVRLGVFALCILGISAGSASANKCREVSSVVGYQRCSSFGADWGWGDAPALSFDIGIVGKRFENPAVNGSGTYVVDGETYRYRLVGDPDTTRTTAFVASFRLMVRRGWLVLGGELDLGPVVGGSSARSPDSNEASLRRETSTYFGTRLVAGIRGELGPLSLALEVAGGLRDIQYSSRVKQNDQMTFVDQWSPELEARLRVDVWRAPRFTIGIAGGKSLLDDSVAMGLFISGHLRAYDARR